MDKRDSIIEAACSAIVDIGIARLTVAAVAERADVSSALVHYHFRTKQQLLVAACERLAVRRSDARTAALAAGGGMIALDELWAAMRTGAESEAERAWIDLALLAREDPSVRRTLAAQRLAEQRALADRLPALLRELGGRAAVAADELAGLVSLFLDGVAQALGAGAAVDDVRAAYDAFWLALVSAGPRRAR
jgi:TetR/AcrR family transcriptional repressor of bet genes